MRDEEIPQCRWVAVVDADGRRRLEMRWHVPVVPAPAQLVATQPIAPRVARAA